jgi:hypothetical protein
MRQLEMSSQEAIRRHVDCLRKRIALNQQQRAFCSRRPAAESKV